MTESSAQYVEYVFYDRVQCTVRGICILWPSSVHSTWNMYSMTESSVQYVVYMFYDRVQCTVRGICMVWPSSVHSTWNMYCMTEFSAQYVKYVFYDRVQCTVRGICFLLCPSSSPTVALAARRLCLEEGEDVSVMRGRQCNILKYLESCSVPLSDI